MVATRCWIGHRMRPNEKRRLLPLFFTYQLSVSTYFRFCLAFAYLKGCISGCFNSRIKETLRRTSSPVPHATVSSAVNVTILQQTYNCRIWYFNAMCIQVEYWLYTKTFDPRRRRGALALVSVGTYNIYIEGFCSLNNRNSHVMNVVCA